MKLTFGEDSDYITKIICFSYQPNHGLINIDPNKTLLIASYDNLDFNSPEIGWVNGIFYGKLKLGFKRIRGPNYVFDKTDRTIEIIVLEKWDEKTEFRFKMSKISNEIEITELKKLNEIGKIGNLRIFKLEEIVDE